MADRSDVSTAAQYEYELTASREDIADLLTGVVDGVLAGTIRLGSGADAVSVGVPDELSLEIELEDEDDELSLELELEWPAHADTSTDPSVETRSEGTSEEPTLVSGANESESLARFEVFRDRDEEWRWRLRHRNGNIIAISGEGYTRKHNAQKGLRSVVKNSSDAEIMEPSTD